MGKNSENDIKCNFEIVGLLFDLVDVFLYRVSSHEGGGAVSAGCGLPCHCACVVSDRSR